MQSKGAFIGLLQPQKGWRLGSPDAKQPLSCTVRAGDNPRHLYSHLSTYIHITKAAALVEGTICMQDYNEDRDMHLVLSYSETVEFYLWKLVSKQAVHSLWNHGNTFWSCHRQICTSHWSDIDLKKTYSPVNANPLWPLGRGVLRPGAFDPDVCCYTSLKSNWW